MAIWIVIIFCLLETVVLTTVIGSVVTTFWAPLAKQFPGKAFEPDAFRRNFQSISLGAISFGGCVHIVADDNFLHLIPSRFLSIFGCTSVSIPWEKIGKPSKQPYFSKRWANITVDHHSKILTIPRWCMDIKNTIRPFL